MLATSTKITGSSLKLHDYYSKPGLAITFSVLDAIIHSLFKDSTQDPFSL